MSAPDDDAFQEDAPSPRRRPRANDRARRDEPDDGDNEDYDDRPRRRRRRRREEEYADIADDAGMRMLLPVGRSGWAMASGYLGLLSVLCIPSPFALITGILAIREMRRDSKKHGMGRAIFGIIMGSIGTVLLMFGLVAFALSPRGR